MKKKNTQHYDTVVKKNLQDILPRVLNELLGTDYQTFTAASVEIPTTLNKKSDLIFETDEAGLLHVEFQTNNDPVMAHRMHLYAALLYMQRPGLEVVRQVMMYVGRNRMRMAAGLEKPNLSFRYQLMDLRDLPYQKFLASSHIEVALFALLGDLQAEEPASVIRQITARLAREANGPEQLASFLVDLEILAQLRNFETIVQQIRKEIVMFEFDVTKISLFREATEAGEKLGLERGMEKGLERGMEKGLKKGMEKGMEQGLEQGLEKGMEKGMAKSVGAMHRNGLGVPEIARLLDLTETEVRRLLAENTGMPKTRAAKRPAHKK